MQWVALCMPSISLSSLFVMHWNSWSRIFFRIVIDCFSRNCRWVWFVCFSYFHLHSLDFSLLFSLAARCASGGTLSTKHFYFEINFLIQLLAIEYRKDMIYPEKFKAQNIWKLIYLTRDSRCIKPFGIYFARSNKRNNSSIWYPFYVNGKHFNK